MCQQNPSDFYLASIYLWPSPVLPPRHPSLRPLTGLEPYPCSLNSFTSTHYFPLSWVLLWSTFSFSPRALTLLGTFLSPQQGTRKTARASARGHVNRDKLQVDIVHASNCRCSQSTRWISRSQNYKCIPFTMQALVLSGLHLGSQKSSGLVSSHRVCCPLTLALELTSHKCRVTYAAIQTHSQSHGAHRPQCHVVSCSGTQAGTHTGSHTSAQSHMATRSHMGPHRLMLLQVTLALPSHTAGTPVPVACMLTVVLELGLPYTKSLS